MIYARRIVAQRCLYGVDKNPLAAEMAKLSLWLLTLQKDKPFTFLDHAIRSGDSLVGIANTHQLTSFSLDGNGPDMPMFTDAIQKRLDAVRLLRRQISELADNSAEDVEKKTLMLQNADQQTQRLAYAADFLLAACWEATSETDRDKRLKQALVHVEFGFKDLPVEELAAEGKQRLLEVNCPKPFHWSLEFPEVFMQRGGFDAIMGNPPFVGGLRFIRTFGETYQRGLFCLNPTVCGNVDYCVFFFRRTFSITHSTGIWGFISTKTISEGDTREHGLQWLLDRHCCIIRAASSVPWPGSASVLVCLVFVAKQGNSPQAMLDDTCVTGISPYLREASEAVLQPFRLAARRGQYFQGSSLSGEGFC